MAHFSRSEVSACGEGVGWDGGRGGGGHVKNSSTQPSGKAVLATTNIPDFASALVRISKVEDPRSHGLSDFPAHLLTLNAGVAGSPNPPFSPSSNHLRSNTNLGAGF